MARVYTPEEKAFMKEFVPGHTFKEIREEFLRRFGGEIPDTFPGCYNHNNGLKTGTSGRFQKGYVPPNKGKKMSSEQYEKCKKSMFKPGHKSYTAVPVGTERIKDGYTLVKVKDTPKVKDSWIPKHCKVWEDHHGSIPNGHVVIHLDGDRTNCNIENLALVTRAVHGTMNQNHLRFDDRELTLCGINIAKLKCAIGRGGA